ncbi:MAG: archease [Candidatus Caldarchaeum sp.]|nr:archease [Candidatus Caldarchaeum sp.]MCX8201229.1 archease [Candidatus Caldarchaeum sp.]MDW8434920.1 archease [Candidatus Caldarchaeum sp.]
MGKRGFHQLKHTADIYLEAYGETLEEAFEQAGLALFRTIIPEAEGADLQIKVEASGADLHELLYDWLEKLLHVFEIQQIVGTQIKVEQIRGNDGYRLEGVVAGVKYDREKHKTGTAVKSPTYALMEIDTAKNAVRFVLDI